MANGANAIQVEGRDACRLGAACVEQATRVVVALPHDLDALVITRSIRHINPEAVVVALIRESANHAIFDLIGVHSVRIGPSSLRGWVRGWPQR